MILIYAIIRILMANGRYIHQPVSTSHFIYGVQIRNPCFDDCGGEHDEIICSLKDMIMTKLKSFSSQYDQLFGLSFIIIKHTTSRCDNNSSDKYGVELNRVSLIPDITLDDKQKLREILDFCQSHDIEIDRSGMMHFAFIEDY